MKIIILYTSKEVVEILEKEPEAKFKATPCTIANQPIEVTKEGFKVRYIGVYYTETYPLKDYADYGHRDFIRENDPTPIKVGV